MFVIKKLNNWFIKNQLDRKVTNIFDYESVIRSRPDVVEAHGTMGFYGCAYTYREYAKYAGIVNACSEHAPLFDTLNNFDFEKIDAPFYFVLSDQRASFIQNKISVPVFSIGPSIAYANCLYDEFDINIIKRELGKTLVIYPVHDGEESCCSSEKSREFISYVKLVKEKYAYDTVLVSMYYVDIERGRHFAYEKEGFIIVTAGRKDNYDFNVCMKTILRLADYVITEGVVSAIGYCTYMNIPVTVYPKKNIAKIKQGSTVKSNGLSDHILMEIENLYKEYSEEVTKAQYEYCKYYYGYDSVLSPEEMSLLFEYLSKIKKSSSEKRMRKIASQEKYSLIYSRLVDCLDRYSKLMKE